jgi:hypothetical protein
MALSWKIHANLVGVFADTTLKYEINAHLFADLPYIGGLVSLCR